MLFMEFIKTGSYIRQWHDIYDQHNRLSENTIKQFVEIFRNIGWVEYQKAKSVHNKLGLVKA